MSGPMGEPSGKRTVSLSVDARLLDEAERAKLDLSRTLERELRARFSHASQEWLDANSDALKAYNERVERNGVLSDEAGLL